MHPLGSSSSSSSSSCFYSVNLSFVVCVILSIILALFCHSALAVRTVDSNSDGDGSAASQPASSSTDSANRYVYSLDHSLDGGLTYSSRGSFEVVFNTKTNKGATVKFTDSKIPNEILQKIRKLSNSAGWYHVKASKSGSEHSAAIQAALPSASVRACALFSSNFHELFHFHLDIYGTLIAIDYRTPIAACNNSTAPNSNSDSDTKEFKARGRITIGKHAEKVALLEVGDNVPPSTAESSDGGSVSSSGSNTEGEAKKKKEEPQTFWEQYRWWFISAGIGWVLLNLLASPPAGQAAGGGGSSGGR